MTPSGQWVVLQERSLHIENLDLLKWAVNLCFLFWRETLAFLYGAHGSGKQTSHVFCYTKSPISSGRATYLITGTFYCNVRHSLTLQPQTHCSPAGEQGLHSLGDSGLTCTPSAFFEDSPYSGETAGCY